MATYRIIRLFDVSATQAAEVQFPDHEAALSHMKAVAAHEIEHGRPPDGHELEHAAIDIEDGAEQMRARYMLDSFENGQFSDEIGYFDCPSASERVEYAASQMLAALRLAMPVCADAYYDALAVQENPTGDAVNYPIENAQATAAALAAWEAVNAAINLAEGRQPDPLDVTAGDTPDAPDAEDANPFHPESPEGQAWERGEGREG